MPEPADPEWWRSAVVYQVWPRRFADGNGDGGYDVADYTATARTSMRGSRSPVAAALAGDPPPVAMGEPR